MSLVRELDVASGRAFGADLSRNSARGEGVKRVLPDTFRCAEPARGGLYGPGSTDGLGQVGLPAHVDLFGEAEEPVDADCGAGTGTDGSTVVAEALVGVVDDQPGVGAVGAVVERRKGQGDLVGCGGVQVPRPEEVLGVLTSSPA